jgi:anion-transporting  ArsA/GET3 family ATPase
MSKEQFQRTSEPSLDVSETIRVSQKEAMRERARQIKAHPETMTADEMLDRINEIESSFQFQKELEAYMPTENEQKIMQIRQIHDEGGVRLAEEMAKDVSEYDIESRYYEMQAEIRKETLQLLHAQEASLKEERAQLSRWLEDLRKVESPYGSNFAA